MRSLPRQQVSPQLLQSWLCYMTLSMQVTLSVVTVCPCRGCSEWQRV